MRALSRFSGKISLCCSRSNNLYIGENYFQRGQDEFSFFCTIERRAPLFCEHKYMLLICTLCSRNGRLRAIKKISHPKGRTYVFLEALFFRLLSRCKTISCKSNVTPPFQRVQPSNGNGQIIRLFVHKRTHKSTTRTSFKGA